jgi:RNA polymerase sigma-70 factor, ECF subfamily
MFETNGETSIVSDSELVALARTGRQEAFGELIARHRHSCINIAAFMLRDRAEAEDEVQKACLKAFEHLDQYHGEAEFVSWLLRIVVNQCLMLIRVKKRTRFLHIDADKPWENASPIELPSEDLDPEEDVIGNELHSFLNREIRRIPPLLRNALVLRDVQELSMPDVAAQLNITVPAAKSRLLRARSELRTRMTVLCGQTGPGASNRQMLGIKLRQLTAGAR